MEVGRRGDASEVKNPENIPLVTIVIALWILRSPLRGGQAQRPQNDKHHF